MKKLLELVPKPLRGTIYAVGFLGLAVAFFLDGGDSGTLTAWIDQASEVAGAVAGLLAAANLRDAAASGTDATAE